MLDASISQVSASISDNSRVTGLRRQITTNNVDSESTVNEDISPFTLNLVRVKSSNDPTRATEHPTR